MTPAQAEKAWGKVERLISAGSTAQAAIKATLEVLAKGGLASPKDAARVLARIHPFVFDPDRRTVPLKRAQATAEALGYTLKGK